MKHSTNIDHQVVQFLVHWLFYLWIHLTEVEVIHFSQNLILYSKCMGRDDGKVMWESKWLTKMAFSWEEGCSIMPTQLLDPVGSPASWIHDQPKDVEYSYYRTGNI
jgi:hypothetical protein